MNIRESAGLALEALRTHVLRTALTLLGVIIGVSSVIVVMSVVQGLDRYVADQVSSAGGDVFTIDRVGFEFDFTKVRDKLKRAPIDPDVAAIIQSVGVHIEAAVAGESSSKTIRSGRRQLRRVSVQGKQPGYMEVEDLPVARGRPLDARDEQSRASVCVLGADLLEDLYPNLDPLGSEIRIGSHRYTVVGIGERKGSSFGQSQDLYVLVPYSTWRKQNGRGGSAAITVKAKGPEHYAQAQEEARAILRTARGVRPGAPDDFELVTPEMYLGLWRNLSGAISIVIVGVSLISLLVGGIVIMNIMLVSVTERTKEIGIRKALGATRRDILTQFLIEAMTLSALGGAIGLLLGCGVTLLLGALTPLPAFISPVAVVLGLLSATLVGVFFGAYPAARAARLDPIEALRYE